MMSPLLRGLAILYAANVAWAAAFALWGLVAATLGRARVVVALFVGPRLCRVDVGTARFELGLLPFPSSSIATKPAEDFFLELDGDTDGGGELGPLPIPEPVPDAVVFGEWPLAPRMLALLGPYVLLALTVAGLVGWPALRTVPGDAVLLARGAASPLGTGADLARGFLRRLPEIPLGEAIGRALGKQFAYLLLPTWGGLWSTLLLMARPKLAQGPAWGRIATVGTFAGLAIMAAWGVAIAAALVR